MIQKSDFGLEIMKSFRRLAKGLTPDQKRIHWEAYAKKTERQEEVFKRVFHDVFSNQSREIIDYYRTNGQLPPTLDDELTARKFEAAIELVYESAFEDAIPRPKQLDIPAKEWILLRSVTIAKSINQTTLSALSELVAGMEAGQTVQQLTRKIDHWFAENEKWKAEMIARTETIAANNEAVLHRFELENIEKSEFYPSPGACLKCLDIAANPIFATKESHNIIPVHPNCRCIWLGVVD